jgi:hypothetical protein
MKENIQLNTPQQQTTQMIPLRSHKISKIIVVTSSLFVGSFQLIVGLACVLFLPLFRDSISEFIGYYVDFGQISVYLSFIPILLLIMMGCLNIYNSIRLIKNRAAFKKAAILTVASLFLQFVLVGVIIFLSIFYPIQLARQNYPPFQTKEICESKTSKSCHFISCQGAGIPIPCPGTGWHPADDEIVRERIPNHVPGWKNYINTKNDYSFDYPDFLSPLPKYPTAQKPTAEQTKNWGEVTFDTWLNYSKLPEQIKDNDSMSVGITVNPTDIYYKPIKCSSNENCLKEVVEKWTIIIQGKENIERKISNETIPGVQEKTDYTGIYQDLVQTQIAQHFVFVKKGIFFSTNFPFISSGRVFVISFRALYQSDDEYKYMSDTFDRILSTFRY